jgi:FOG: WD40 repeat
MSYRGSTKSRGGRGRGPPSRGGGRGGRSSTSYGGARGAGGGYGAADEPKPHIQLCSYYTSQGHCERGDGCNFQHVIKMHKTIVNSDPDPSSTSGSSSSGSNRSSYNRGGGYGSQTAVTMFPTSDIALWNDPSVGALKIFTASHDGHWRLYNTATGFSKEVQHNMGGKVNTVLVQSNFLFCGFEGTSVKLPGVTVGMIFAWNLGNPGEPPIELHMHETAPYAHASGVTCFITEGDMCVSGGHDCAIRVWKFDATVNAGKGGFKLINTLCGHAGEITGLVIVGTMLWSCAMDMTIRLWDSAANWECKYVITQTTQGNAATPMALPPNGQQGTGVGHTDAITGLLHFESAAGNFVLSSSLDGNVKVWNSVNGECLSTTNYGVGVISMALTTDLKNNPLLIAGTAYGKIMIRSLIQTATTAPMCYLCAIDTHRTHCGHDGPVKRVIAGPSNTFYTAGDDGNVIIFQITGDFGL